jgi:hypothetical protein
VRARRAPARGPASPATALDGRQEGVARRQREAVRIANGRQHAELDLEREVADQRADHLGLLRILLPEVRAAGAHDREELEHDRRHAAEVTGPEPPFEDRAELGDVDPGLEAGRVHLIGARCEDDVDAFLLRELEVALLVARVAGEVAALGELSRVDEQAHDDGLVLGPRGPEEREVAAVQRTHGRHEPDRPGARRLENRPDVLDRPRDVHEGLPTPCDNL